MAANQDPIFGKVPATAYGVLINAANTARDGTGSNFFTCGTAGSEGAPLSGVRFWGSQASVGASTAKVCMIWVFLGSTCLYKAGEVVLPAVTSSNSAIVSTALWTPDKPIMLLPSQLVKLTQSLAGTAADYTWAYPFIGDY